MHYISTFMPTLNQGWRSWRLLSSSPASYPVILISFAALGIAIGSYAIYQAWNKLKERKIIPIPTEEPVSNLPKKMPSPIQPTKDQPQSSELQKLKKEEIKKEVAKGSKKPEAEEPIFGLDDIFDELLDTEEPPAQTNLTQDVQKPGEQHASPKTTSPASQLNSKASDIPQSAISQAEIPNHPADAAAIPEKPKQDLPPAADVESTKENVRKFARFRRRLHRNRPAPSSDSAAAELNPNPQPAQETAQPKKPLSPPVKEETFEKFYLNEGLDVEKRTLVQIQNLNFKDKEKHHNYIQWLFPTDQASKYNAKGPVFTADQIKTFSQNPVIKENVKLSFIKMLEFYGLEYEEKTLTVQKVLNSKNGKDFNFEERAKNWLAKPNHNFLRLSRILRSLNLFGLTDEAKALNQFLMSLLPHRAIPKTSVEEWTKAMRPVDAPS